MVDNFNWSIANNNGGTVRDVYPSAVGATTGQSATGATSVTPGGAMPASNDPVTKAAVIGGTGNPVVAGIIFFVLVFGLMFLAKRLGTDDDFKSLKPSVYNVVTIAVAATAGMPVLKFLATKFPVPGISTWVLAA